MDNRIILACLLTAAGIIIPVLGAVLFRRARFRKEPLQLGKTNIGIEKCPYCGSDYPVRDDIERCPRCGGDLKLHRSALARDEGKISMSGKDDTGIS
jgi:hypothetical protein